MNNYFITKEDLDDMRDHMFTVIAKSLNDIRNEFLLILDSVGYKVYLAKNKKGNKMSEKKIKTLIEKLWILADKLENKELISIAKGLEEYVAKRSTDIKKFHKELKGLLERVKALEEARK